jgi:hypothetical protein
MGPQTHDAAKRRYHNLPIASAIRPLAGIFILFGDKFFGDKHGHSSDAK